MLVSRCWQGGAAGVATVRRGRGCPVLTQPDPVGSTKDPPQDAAKPSSQTGGASVKTPHRQSRSVCGGEQKTEREREKQKCKTMAKEWGEGPALWCWSRHSPAVCGLHAGVGVHFLAKLWPVESPCWIRLILKDSTPWTGPTKEQRKSVRQRGAVMDWPQPPYPLSPSGFRGRVGNAAGPGKRWGETLLAGGETWLCFLQLNYFH